MTLTERFPATSHKYDREAGDAYDRGTADAYWDGRESGHDILSMAVDWMRWPNSDRWPGRHLIALAAEDHWTVGMPDILKEAAARWIAGTVPECESGPTSADREAARAYAAGYAAELPRHAMRAALELRREKIQGRWDIRREDRE